MNLKFCDVRERCFCYFVVFLFTSMEGDSSTHANPCSIPVKLKKNQNQKMPWNLDLLKYFLCVFFKVPIKK